MSQKPKEVDPNAYYSIKGKELQALTQDINELSGAQGVKCLTVLPLLQLLDQIGQRPARKTAHHDPPPDGDGEHKEGVAAAKEAIEKGAPLGVVIDPAKQKAG